MNRGVKLIFAQWMWRILSVLVVTVLGGCGECEDDYACPSNQICNVETAQCEDYECRQDRECVPGHRCQNNRCQAQEPKTQPAVVEPLPVGKQPKSPDSMSATVDESMP